MKIISVFLPKGNLCKLAIVAYEPVELGGRPRLSRRSNTFWWLPYAAVVYEVLKYDISLNMRRSSYKLYS